jgi:hypothetical protein
MKNMKRAILTISTLGAIVLLASMWPDIQRYMRIRSM